MKLSEGTKHELVDLAHRAADAARDVTLAYFRRADLRADNKSTSEFDPVTQADREAELAIRAVLLQARPQDAIEGEEQADHVGQSGLTWVLDPIDGTRGFISGTPTWGTLISVRDETGPIFGIIDQPHVGERFIGGFGISELRHQDTVSRLGVRAVANLSEATLFTTFPEVGTKIEGEAFHRLAGEVRLTRYGMDCYAYALLAAGNVDLVVEAGLHSFDIQAPIAVIQAAGGIVTDWHGGPVHQGGRVIAAASAKLHDEALAILSLYPEN